VAYITCLKSAKELYGEPLRRMDILSIEEYDLIFEKLLKIADKCSQVIKEVSPLSLISYLFIMINHYIVNLHYFYGMCRDE